MATATHDFTRRAIILSGIPKPVPPRDARAGLHRLLDEALDALADDGLQPVPEGPGRIADQC